MLDADPPKNQPFWTAACLGSREAEGSLARGICGAVERRTLTTAGNLVSRVRADGRFIAYNATTGEKLWETPVGSGVVAAASTYMIDGKQYVSIAVGWGGVFGIAVRATELSEPGHGLHLRGRWQRAAAGLREVPDRGPAAGVKYDPKDVPEGTALYVAACAQCHGVPGVHKGGNVRNLAYVPKETIENLKDFVFKGPYRDQGMPYFTGKLKEDDILKIQAFIQGTADAIRPK